MKQCLSFFYSLLSSDSTQSSRRFITLIVSFHFILASFLILFLFGFVIFIATPNINLEVLKIIINIVQIILEYDFYIMLAGLSFVSVTDFGKIMISKYTNKRKDELPEVMCEDDKTNFPEN